jgi:hypothetical protein
MAALLASRRRLIARQGRPMTLRRQATASPPAFTTVAVRGVLSRVTPGELKDGLRQADSRIEILADEITAAAWPAPPKAADSVATPEGVVAVLAATPVYDGETLIGYRLFGRAAA